MLLLNANGGPVKTTTVAIQIDIDVPTEGVVSLGAPNWGAILVAVFQLVTAYATGNPAAIAAAIQALFKAIMGG